METNKETESQKRKLKRIFKFCPNKIAKLQPVGNQTRGIECPKPRSGHRIVVKGGNVYAFGGYTPINLGGGAVDHILFEELWKYNCASKTWKLLETSGYMPDTLASHSAALIYNHMLVFGGTGIPFGDTSSNSTHACNLDSLEWIEIETTGSPPSEQYGQAMVLDGVKMYVVGGTTGYDYSMDVHCLDLETKVWTALESKSTDWKPPPRYRHEIAIKDKTLFIFGGGTAFASYDFKEVPIFNLDTNTWSKVSTSDDCPAARRCHGCVQIGTDVYICGGHDGSTIFSDIWKFDLKTLQWEKLRAELPTSVYFHSAAVSNTGKLFVFGGVDSIRANTRINELYSMWLKIPSLAEICWEAILKYIPHISQLGKRKLHEAGIPTHFIKEIDFDTSSNSSLTNCCDRLQS